MQPPIFKKGIHGAGIHEEELTAAREHTVMQCGIQLIPARPDPRKPRVKPIMVLRKRSTLKYNLE